MKINLTIAACCLALFANLGVAQETAESPRQGRPKTETSSVSGKMPSAAMIKEGAAKLTPANSKIEFVGTHVGDDPKPRLGGFKKFEGKIQMAEDGKAIKSLHLDVDTTSVWTQIGDKLTNHLKNADFLDVEKYPKASFVSKKISAGESEGTVDIVGDFTLMGKTNEITLPSKIKIDGESVSLQSELSIDRTSFGMTKMTEGVSKAVAIKFVIGESGTNARASSAQRRRQRGRFDPAAMFKQQDADGDGKLTGDEIPDRMKQNIGVFDKDGDGSVSLEEIQNAMKAFQQGAGAPNLRRPGAGRNPGGNQGSGGGNRPDGDDGNR